MVLFMGARGPRDLRESNELRSIEVARTLGVSVARLHRLDHLLCPRRVAQGDLAVRYYRADVIALYVAQRAARPT